MIYPGKRKVRSFSKGGGTASLFDNPGTYLGIQYIPTAQQGLPDIDGLQYIAQMEQAKTAKMSEQAKANALTSEDLGKAVKDLKGLTGETNSAIQVIESQFAEWQSKYNDISKMSTNQAAADKARILNNIARVSNQLLNSKDEFDKSYDRSKDVLGDVHTDGGNVFVLDPNDPSVPKAVSIKDYFEKKDTDYKDVSFMTNDDIFNWRRNYRQFGVNDRVMVDQYSEKETRAYINDHFDKIGVDTRSIDGSGEFASILQSVGLDPSKFDRNDLKVKVSTGELNLETLSNAFMKTMDHKVLKGLVSSMLSNGENPYEMVIPEGGKEPVSKINLRIHEILTGVKAGMNTSIEIGKTDDNGSGGAYDVITNILNRTTNLDSMTNIDPIMRDQLGNFDIFNPYVQKKVTARGMVVPNLSKEDMERINGKPMEFGRIANDQVVYFNGQKQTIGSVTDESDGALYFDTGNPLNIITFDVKDQAGKDARVNVMEKEILVNEAGLKRFGLDENAVKRGVQGARIISDDELEALPGITPELAEQLSGSWFTIDGENYLIRIQVPLSELAGHGGKTPGKASDAQNATFNRGLQEQKTKAESNMNKISQEAQNMISFSR